VLLEIALSPATSRRGIFVVPSIVDITARKPRQRERRRGTTHARAHGGRNPWLARRRPPSSVHSLAETHGESQRPARHEGGEQRLDRGPKVGPTRGRLLQERAALLGWSG